MAIWSGCKFSILTTEKDMRLTPIRSSVPGFGQKIGSGPCGVMYDNPQRVTLKTGSMKEYCQAILERSSVQNQKVEITVVRLATVELKSLPTTTLQVSGERTG